MEEDGVVERVFVRRDFYILPPDKNASPEVWDIWLKQDRQLAIQAKRLHTRSLKHAEVPEALRPKVMAKTGGVWRQCVLSGLVGSVDDGSLRIEAAVDADQDKALVVAQYRHGGRGVRSSTRNGSAKRRARRERMLNRRK